MSIRSSISLTALLIGALVLVQLVFLGLQRSESLRVFKSFQAVFRSDDVVANPYKISSELEDLTYQGTITCPTLESVEAGKYYLDRRDLRPCFEDYLQINGSFVEDSIQSINNSRWKISFFVPSSFFFKISLWASRLVIILSILLVWNLMSQARRRVEVEKMRADMERDNARFIEDLAKQLAHDLRSPLSAINLIIQKANLDDSHKSVLAIAIDRLNTIASSVLRKRVPSIGISEVSDINKLLQQGISQKRIELQASPNIGIDLSIAADKYFVKISSDDFLRIVSNLINNAAEAIGTEAGVIRVMASNIADKVEIIFSDTGLGIPPEIVDRIWTRDFSYGKEGAGLGLYHAKQALEKVGGSIEVLSISGWSASFRIVLPLHFESTSGD